MDDLLKQEIRMYGRGNGKYKNIGKPPPSLKYKFQTNNEEDI